MTIICNLKIDLPSLCLNLIVSSCILYEPLSSQAVWLFDTWNIHGNMTHMSFTWQWVYSVNLVNIHWMYWVLKRKCALSYSNVPSTNHQWHWFHVIDLSCCKWALYPSTPPPMSKLHNGQNFRKQTTLSWIMFFTPLSQLTAKNSKYQYLKIRHFQIPDFQKLALNGPPVNLL